MTIQGSSDVIFGGDRAPAECARRVNHRKAYSQMSLATLPKTVRTFARLRVIAQVLSKHGFGHFVDQLQLGRYLPSADWFRRGKGKAKDVTEESHPLTLIGERLVKVCEELGPTFVKLAQMASTRPDILPPQIASALERLQDDVQPFASEQARRIFLTDTGSTVDEAFRSFTDEPFASGSIGQVHRAVTKDDQDVVVKIKRPGIDSTVQLDIYVLQWLAEQAEAHFPELRPYRPKMLIDEFAQTMRKELDFINEASATARFYEAFKDDPHITTPAVIWEHTGSNVLTLEYLHGLHLRDVLEKGGRPDSFKCDRKALASSLAECFLRQFFELGIFHADPHPGNLLIEVPDKILLFDFGMVGQMSDELISNFVIAIVAALKKETEVLIEVLADLGTLGRATDRDLLGRDLAEFIDKYYGLPVRRLDMSIIFRELIEIVRRNDVTLPRDFVAMFKSLATISNVIVQIDPELNLAELIQPKLSKLVQDRLSPRRLTRIAGMSLWHIVSVLRDAPRLIRDIMRGIGRGQFQVNIKHENLDYLARELDRSSNRLSIAVLMASIIVGSSMLLSMAADVSVFGRLPIRYLGFVGYALSFVLAAWLVVAIIRSGKMS